MKSHSSFRRSVRDRTTAPAAVMEALAPRLLLSVTLDNGLPPDDPAFFSVLVDRGGASNQATFGGVDTDPIFDYSALLDVAGEVFDLSGWGSEAGSGVSAGLLDGSGDYGGGVGVYAGVLAAGPT